MDKRYRVIDLFAGVGGIRLGFEQAGSVETVFSAEIDKYACQTYLANFGESPMCDLTKVSDDDIKNIPDFHILLAGFPCQAFSIAGRKGGFEDTRGTLFFDVARILKIRRPPAFLLENVKGLTHHDKGKTFKTILNTLENELGYTVHYRVLNSKEFGAPQKRERIYIVGFDGDPPFAFPKPKGATKKVKDVFEKREVSSKFYLSQRYYDTLIEHKNRHADKGNGFGYEILDPNDVANAIVVGGMGKERNLVIDKRLTDFTPKTNIVGEINSSYVRRLTPREWARLQGFPDSFVIPVSDTQAYKQFGNSVSVPVVKAIAKQLLTSLDKLQAGKIWEKEISGSGASYTPSLSYSAKGSYTPATPT
ncbi:MAG: DNA (cytosine-5-)-methyltransferase [Ignavibacteriales bacterium]|nr:DNA (cytosine-5-)-methyltransferase [Ignavibacteriales bacterium]